MHWMLNLLIAMQAGACVLLHTDDISPEADNGHRGMFVCGIRCSFWA